MLKSSNGLGMMILTSAAVDADQRPYLDQQSTDLRDLIPLLPPESRQYVLRGRMDCSSGIHAKVECGDSSWTAALKHSPAVIEQLGVNPSAQAYVARGLYEAPSDRTMRLGTLFIPPQQLQQLSFTVLQQSVLRNWKFALRISQL